MEPTLVRMFDNFCSRFNIMCSVDNRGVLITNGKVVVQYYWCDGYSFGAFLKWFFEEGKPSLFINESEGR